MARRDVVVVIVITISRLERLEHKPREFSSQKLVSTHGPQRYLII